MRTTVDLPDELLRRARQRAADEETTLSALLVEGLRLRLDPPAASSQPRRQLPLSSLGGGLHPWIDPASNSSLLDAADDDGAAA